MKKPPLPEEGMLLSPHSRDRLPVIPITRENVQEMLAPTWYFLSSLSYPKGPIFSHWMTRPDV